MSPVETLTQKALTEEQGLRRILAFDEALLVSTCSLHRGWLTALMRGLTRLGDFSSWLVLALAFAALGGTGLRCALLLTLGALGALGLSQVLKRIFRRPRPTEGMRGFAPLTHIPDAFSFPSGHTAVAFGVALALLGESLALPWLVLPLAWIFLPLAVGIALSRVYLGAHYPLDVAVGAFLGTVSGVVAGGLVDGSFRTAFEAVALLAGWA